MLLILLDAQSNPLTPFLPPLGFAIAIAMIWIFTRQGKKDKKENTNADDKNKMV